MALTDKSPTQAVDVVAVFLPSGAQAFAAARPMLATVDENSALMEHPLEDGSVIADHIVFGPVQIDLPVVLGGDFRQTFDDIRQLWKKGTLLRVQTRAATYENMAILGAPHEETPDNFDTITVNLRFREAKIIKAQYGGKVKVAPRDPKKQTTVKRGTVQATTPTAPRGSFLYRHVPVR